MTWQRQRSYPNLLPLLWTWRLPQPQLHKLEGVLSWRPESTEDSSLVEHMCHKLLVKGREVEDAMDHRKGDATDFKGASLMTDFRRELILSVYKWFGENQYEINSEPGTFREFSLVLRSKIIAARPQTLILPLLFLRWVCSSKKGYVLFWFCWRIFFRHPFFSLTLSAAIIWSET